MNRSNESGDVAVSVDCLRGRSLNVAMAMLEGNDPTAAALFQDEGHYDYCGNWALGGPLLEMEGITFDRYDDGATREQPWLAESWTEDGNEEAHARGRTMLEAGMRCILKRRHGPVMTLPRACAFLG